MAAAALRPTILCRIRLSPSLSLALAAAASHPHALARWLARPMSPHDAHLTREEVVDHVLDVLKSHSKVDPSKVTPEAHFQKDLELDSLDTIEVVMAIEEEFKLEIPDLGFPAPDPSDLGGPATGSSGGGGNVCVGGGSPASAEKRRGAIPGLEAKGRASRHAAREEACARRSGEGGASNRSASVAAT